MYINALLVSQSDDRFHLSVLNLVVIHIAYPGYNISHSRVHLPGQWIGQRAVWAQTDSSCDCLTLVRTLVRSMWFKFKSVTVFGLSFQEIFIFNSKLDLMIHNISSGLLNRCDISEISSWLMILRTYTKWPGDRSLMFWHEVTLKCFSHICDFQAVTLLLKHLSLIKLEFLKLN